jgi:hypothetical protein
LSESHVLLEHLPEVHIGDGHELGSPSPPLGRRQVVQPGREHPFDPGVVIAATRSDDFGDRLGPLFLRQQVELVSPPSLIALYEVPDGSRHIAGWNPVPSALDLA